MHPNRAGGSPLTGGSFFAEPQRGVALCGARETAAPAAGAKRKGHLRFPFLFELLPFPCLLARRKSESGDRFENGVRQSGYRCVRFATCSQFTDSVLLHIRLTLRRRDIAVSRNHLTRYTAQHLRIRRLIQFIFAGAVYCNAQEVWSALLCRPLRRVADMCSRTVSDTANMRIHERTQCVSAEEKLLCRSPASQRSHVGNLRRAL